MRPLLLIENSFPTIPASIIGRLSIEFLDKRVIIGPTLHYVLEGVIVIEELASPAAS